MAKKETSAGGNGIIKKFKKKGRAAKKWSNNKKSKNYKKSYKGQGRA